MVESSEGAEVKSLLPWEAALRRAGGRNRILELISQRDAAERIRGLAPLEAYQAIKQVGSADAVAVLGLLTEEQTRVLLDLDIWRDGDLDIPDVLIWFEAFRAAGLGALVKAARALDEEALALLLRRRLHITLKPKDDASEPEPLPEWAVKPPEALLPLVETPDGRFVIAARIFDEFDDEARAELDEEERKGVLQLVTELYRDQDWEHVAGMLRSAMADLSTNLSEDALRFRNARLEDLGFPPVQRAIEVYGPLDVSALRTTPQAPYPALGEVLPLRYAEPLARGLFHAAMNALQDPELVRRIEGDLVPMANAALVADGAEPGTIEHLQDTMTRARGYIELALAHDTPSGAERVRVATDRLANNHVQTLFRVGYTLTLATATRARALASAVELEQDGLPMGRLEAEERVALDALRARRPRVSAALESVVEAVRAQEPPARLLPDPEESSRAFDAPEDLEAVRWLLADLEGLRAALEPRGRELRAASERPANVPSEERTAELFIATAVGRALLDLTPGVQPLRPDEVAQLTSAVEDGRIPPVRAGEAVASVVAWFGVEAGSSAVKRRAEGAISRLERAIEPLGGAQIDPRFFGELLIEA